MLISLKSEGKIHSVVKHITRNCTFNKVHSKASFTFRAEISHFIFHSIKLQYFFIAVLYLTQAYSFFLHFEKIISVSYICDPTISGGPFKLPKLLSTTCPDSYINASTAHLCTLNDQKLGKVFTS